MGRLVTPLSQEEWDKLPDWQKWASNHGILLVCILFLFLIVLVVVL